MDCHSDFRTEVFYLSVRKQAERANPHMTHYVAIVEEEEGKAVGVWFPDLPGCVSAGDTLDEAIQNAAEALELWAEAMIESGQEIPPPRSLTDLKADSDVAPDLANFMVALIPFPEGLRRRAAE
jgi:predicted RNase H-like HicB family nuclease